MNCPLKDMVTMLVDLIGNTAAPDSDDMEGVCAAGEAAGATHAGQGGLGKAECASMARLLLNLVLELFGAQAISLHHRPYQPCTSMIWSDTFSIQEQRRQGVVHAVWDGRWLAVMLDMI